MSVDVWLCWTGLAWRLLWTEDCLGEGALVDILELDDGPGAMSTLRSWAAARGWSLPANLWADWMQAVRYVSPKEVHMGTHEWRAA